MVVNTDSMVCTVIMGDINSPADDFVGANLSKSGTRQIVNTKPINIKKLVRIAEFFNVE